ncbi:5-dehydro-4-deoxyglucarate dehydratase [Kineosporia succinea]|uniref:Probable 5-dehydro-4-deoxyglucarate dehydratase n=1 Tax=Kineosporia succinea TaxID=84632 RepID=A0ABT9P228_9ACTN|nr:5-dehydro-4-deoxyglucarate dehydratase [Kineosporia succinea]MDP9826737.1 5-dehydro-4-deoxyglucarate dehydratase [Kineosporia succinea]
MSRFSPTELRDALGSGLLSFPVTHTDAELALDEGGLREHLRYLREFDAAGLFAAGGTGEFFALTPSEVERVVRISAQEVTDVPVVGPAGYGTGIAVEMTQAAQGAGADGIFLLPPYLTEMTQEGLYEHVARVCSSTDLGVIVYHRANAKFTAKTVNQLVDRFDNFIGFKDGIGDIDLMANLYATHGDRLVYVGGLPTAETYALPYLELGATTYSSAIYNFAPRWAGEFYRSVRSRDRDDVYRRLREFVFPYLEIRNRRAGYAVSIVKAGLQAVGRPAGSVRPPLVDLTDAELADLTDLVKKVA